MNPAKAKGGNAYTYTSNLKAATALATLGFEFHEETPITRVVRADGKESLVFWFKDSNQTGQRAMEVVEGMTKGGELLEKQDPDNIINYLRAYAANRDVLVDLIRNTPRMVEFERNGKRIILSENATDEMKEKIARFM